MTMPRYRLLLLPDALPGVDRVGLAARRNDFGLVSSSSESTDVRRAYEAIGGRCLIGFDIDDIERSRVGRPTLVPPWQGSDGFWRAVIEDNGVATLVVERPERDGAAQGDDSIRYHSCWFPTTRPLGNRQELHLQDLKMWVLPYGDSPFRLGWVRYQVDAPYPSVVGQIPHLAFEVSRIDSWLARHQILIEPNTPTEGLTVAFVAWCGIPVELLQVDRAVLPDGI